MTARDDSLHTVPEILRMPLRWLDRDSADDATVIADRGWFQGAAECARFLAGSYGGEVESARAFGERWPVVAVRQGLMVPAIPVVVSDRAGDGVDAGYQRRGDEVWREAGGVEELVLDFGGGGGCPGEAFDLLWFGDSDRWVLRGGALHIDDFFAHVQLPADRRILEQLLIRGRRAEPALLDGLSFDHPPRAAKITVRRAMALASNRGCRSPEEFFLARADVERVKDHAGQLEILTCHGERVMFSCREEETGWRASLEDGSYLVTGFALERQGGVLTLSADLDPQLDVLAPGVRGRLAFDLRSDLVTMG